MTLTNQLKKLGIEYRDDTISRDYYSYDASIFKIKPHIIVFPKSTKDIEAAVHLAKIFHLPITARGAATGTTGGCLGRGMIIDTSLYLNQIIKLDKEKKTVTVQPGVVQDVLNDYLKPHGFCLGPDTSTGNRATIGGMVSNNAAGARSLIYGAMVDHIISVKMTLSRGDTYIFSEKETPKDILQAIKSVLHKYNKEIAENIPHLDRLSSGYLLHKIVDNNQWNPAKLIAGSEGTLGIISEVTLKISPLPPQQALFLISFPSLKEALKAVETLLPFNPSAIEYLDHHILKQTTIHKDLKHPQVLLVEFFAPFEERLKKIKKMFNYQSVILYDKNEMATVFNKRKSALGLLLSKRSYQRACAFIEDIALPLTSLTSFMEAFVEKCKSWDIESSIYGHFGAGCLHIRPYLNLLNEDELNKLQQIQKETADLLLKYKGALSGEHGDGLIRSHLNPKFFGPALTEAFSYIKQTFDQDNLMNPGKIVHPKPFPEELRLHPELKIKEIPTYLDFSKEGGLSLSIDMCNSNGLCRKSKGLMCPSFQATGNEYDSTRARALSLRSLITGELPLKEFGGDAIHDILSLCLSCKGCKKECPSQVDMAKMKAEHLYQRYQLKTMPIKERLIANTSTLLKWASPLSSLLNYILPIQLAKRPFSKWYTQQQKTPKKDICGLFIDTFTEYLHPEVGEAAVTFLNQHDIQVIPIAQKCCGRPAFSKGDLKKAKEQGLSLLKEMIYFTKNNMPIIFLEPSCISMFLDDYKSLIPEQIDLIKDIERLSYSFESFLLKRNLLKDRKKITQQVLYHGHCHDKALSSTMDALSVLNQLYDAKEISSGCCGMAGAFGFEHPEISQKIGQLQLFPTVNAYKEALIVANGTSCRHQIIKGTGRHPLHIAEVLNLSSNPSSSLKPSS